MQYFKVTGLKSVGQAVSILIRGSIKLVLDEAERSLHDALCVIRCLVKKRALLPGFLHNLLPKHTGKLVPNLYGETTS
jgi:chaperonin GroEL (HSP60 family)